MEINLDAQQGPRSLNYEQHRLTTFRSWPVQAPIQPDRLAKAGFYYLGNNLEVVCFTCGGRISNWNYGDIVISKHSMLFPNCKFVKNESNNVPMLTWTDDSTRRNAISTDRPISMETHNARTFNNPSNSSSWESNYSETSGDGLFENGYQELPVSRPSSHTTVVRIPQHLKVETERLKTFGRWPLDFISPVDLAKAGFFYLQIGDKVQCVFCHGVLTNWVRGDTPYIEHVNNFSLCPFVMGRDVGNVPNGTGDTVGRPNPVPQNGELRHWPNSVPENRQQSPVEYLPTSEYRDIGITPHKGPEHPAQATKDARMRSFLSWPQHAAVQPEQLVDAGFFYIGINDHAKCFYCDGGLCNWEPNDNPWVEHARWFPDCAYVKLNKGGGFIEQAKKEHNSTSMISGGCCQTGNSGSPNNLPGPSQQHLSDVHGAQKCGLPNGSLLDQQVDMEMQSNMVKAFLRTNSSPAHVVRLAILRKLQETGLGVRTVDQLCEAIHKVENEKPKTFTSEVIQGKDEKIGSGNLKDTSGSDVPPHPAQSGSPNSNVSLEEENRQLREQRMCKICMDQEVGVVFLPCGHLICCVQCAPALKDCAFCRQPIKGTIRTFLS